MFRQPFAPTCMLHAEGKQSHLHLAGPGPILPNFLQCACPTACSTLKGLPLAEARQVQGLAASVQPKWTTGVPPVGELCCKLFADPLMEQNLVLPLSLTHG